MINEIKSFDDRKKELVKKGKEQGFITYEELVSGIAGYINYYNNERYQWKLKSLTPAECRNQAA